MSTRIRRAVAPVVGMLRSWACADRRVGGGSIEPLEPRNLFSAVVPLDQTFTLHSRPGATKTIYLDFNGHLTPGTTGWNGGQPFNTPAYSIDGSASFSNTELTNIQDIWQRVAEDFAPFEVDVTTEDPGGGRLTRDNSDDIYYGTRVAIGGDGFWLDGGLSSGVAFLNSFSSFTPAPAFVFSEGLSPAEIADTASHETGHTLGLSHDGTPGNTYYRGHGSGPTSWAPIMGSGDDRELTQWSNGNYPGANNFENDLAIITTRNGFGYRADDYGNSTATAAALSLSGDSVFASGVIEKNTDVDVFSFATSGGNVSINIDPAALGPNLDILAILYNANGGEVARNNPIGSLNASFNLTLPAGKYYLAIDGTGELAPGPGYNDYGSLGQYTVTGTVAGAYILDVDDTLPRANVVVTPKMNQTTVLNGDITTLGSESDVDIFRIKAAKGAFMRFDVDAAEVGSGLNSHLRLFNRWGQEVTANDDKAAPGEPATDDSAINYTFTTGGFYYLAVSASGNVSYDVWSGGGDAAPASTGAYTLNISRLPPVRDLDDQRREATLLTLAATGAATSFQGAIATLEDDSSDVDVVKFFAQAGTTVRFDIADSGGLDSYLRLFNRTGFQLAFSDTSIEFTFAKRGMYFLGLSAAGNTAYNVNNGKWDAAPASTGTYDLTLTTVSTPFFAPATDLKKPRWSLVPVGDVATEVADVFRR